MQRFYVVDLRKPNEEWAKEYEDTLSPDAPVAGLLCGEKGCYPSNAELVSKIVKQMVNIVEKKPIITIYIGAWGSDEGIYRKEATLTPVNAEDLYDDPNYGDDHGDDVPSDDDEPDDDDGETDG